MSSVWGAKEREVRTRAGWIGVEISRSRVRTPGKAGYGLYRVRGSSGRAQTGGRIHNRQVTETAWSDWTPYLFGLAEIDRAVRQSISAGVPSAPGELRLSSGPLVVAGVTHVVPTRWTQQYRGRRDLGVPLTASDSQQVPGADALRAAESRSTVRSRQRDHNAAFQAEHAVRRAHGLEARHARKLAELEPRTPKVTDGQQRYPDHADG